MVKPLTFAYSTNSYGSCTCKEKRYSYIKVNEAWMCEQCLYAALNKGTYTLVEGSVADIEASTPLDAGVPIEVEW